MNDNEYRKLEQICARNSLYRDFRAALPDDLFQKVFQTDRQNGTSLFMASAKGNARLTEFLISLFSEERILPRILLAESPVYGPACTLYIAAKAGHADVVFQLIQAAKTLEDETLKKMLLAGSLERGPANALRVAAQEGHHMVVAQLIQAAQGLGNGNEALKIMLLASFQSQGLAHALCIAAQNGHHMVADQLIQAARGLRDGNETLKTMLLAISPDGGLAGTLRIAAKKGHNRVIARLIQATQGLGDGNETLKTMLLAESPDEGPTTALCSAAQENKVIVVGQLIQAAQDLKDKNKTLETMFLATLDLGGGDKITFQNMLHIAGLNKQHKKIFREALLNGVISEKITVDKVISKDAIPIIKKEILNYFENHYSHDIHSQLMDKGTPLRRFIGYRQSFMLSHTEQSLLHLFQQKKEEAEGSATTAYDSECSQAAVLFHDGERKEREVEYLLSGDLGL